MNETAKKAQGFAWHGLHGLPGQAVCLSKGLSGAAVRRYDGKVAAAGKGVAFNAFDAAGNGDLRQRTAACKGGRSDFANAVRNDDFRQRRAAEEGGTPDGGDAFGEGDGDGGFVAVRNRECALAVVFKSLERQRRIIRVGEGIADIGQNKGSQAVGAADPRCGAAVECEDIDAVEVVVQMNLFQRGAGIKGMCADRGDAFGDPDIRK